MRTKIPSKKRIGILGAVGLGIRTVLGLEAAEDFYYLVF